MREWQERVVQERDELMEKIQKLSLFFDTEVFKVLPKGEKYRLIQQHVFMVAYHDVLDERICNFPKADDVRVGPRKILRRTNMTDGATEIELECGHVTIQVVPLPKDWTAMRCAQCVNDLVAEARV